MKKLRITFFNVGHGSCTHIITPNNQHWLVDVGTDEDNSVVQFINNYYQLQLCGQQIECLFITHHHIDHILDLPKLLASPIKPRFLWREKDAFPIENALTPSDKIVFDSVNAMHAEYSHPVDSFTDPTNADNNGGVSISIMPTPIAYHKPEDLNSYSPIIIINYVNKKIILTGDNNKEILKQWIEEGLTLRTAIKDCDILLAPHHGRDTDFCMDFFQLANPRLTIVSDKPKEHESQEKTTEHYRGRGLWVDGEERYVLTTRTDGNILLTVEENGTLNIQRSALPYGY